MIVIVQTQDRSIQATEIAEALEDWQPDRVVVKDTKGVGTPEERTIDEWERDRRHHIMCDRDLCFPECEVRQEKEGRT